MALPDRDTIKTALQVSQSVGHRRNQPKIKKILPRACRVPFFANKPQPSKTSGTKFFFSFFSFFSKKVFIFLNPPPPLRARQNENWFSRRG